MKLFKLNGLVSPGRVNLLKYGTVCLENISDQLAEQIWKDGCPYLELTAEGRAKFFPDEAPIEVKAVNVTSSAAVTSPKTPKRKTKK